MKRIIKFRMRMLLAAGFCISILSGIAGAHISADVFGTGANQFEIDFVKISGATNPTSGYGIVQNDYRIGKFEITNDQWNKFVNNNGAPAGIPSNAYDENAYWTGTNIPTNNVSWYEMGQFANWLNTSTGHQAAYNFDASGNFSAWSSGDVGYNPSNPYRNSNACYFLPTEDEWVKAAYWNGTDLQPYSNASADDLLFGLPDPAKWNHYPSGLFEPWAVGSGEEELNGTFDMMGNVWEYIESPYNSGDFGPASLRVIRGGSCNDDYADTLISSYRTDHYPNDEFDLNGFRIASVVDVQAVPVPGSLVLSSIGIASVGWLKRRKCQ